MTAAPASFSRRTIAAPTRFEPPVTSATFPDRGAAMCFPMRFPMLVLAPLCRRRGD
jgi:hypothetical protein